MLTMGLIPSVDIKVQKKIGIKYSSIEIRALGFNQLIGSLLFRKNLYSMFTCLLNKIIYVKALVTWNDNFFKYVYVQVHAYTHRHRVMCTSLGEQP